MKNNPFGILEKSKEIVDGAKFITINPEKLEELAEKVKQRYQKGLPTREEEFNSSGDYQKDVQQIFLQNCVNFCYWAEKRKEKWKVEFNGQEEDGAMALSLAFTKAVANRIPILDANYLKNLTLEDVKEIFAPSNGIKIPLINERLNNLKEAGIGLEKFGGQFANLIEKANYDAIEVTKQTVASFPSFNDSPTGIPFLKRAQLNAYDVSLPGHELKNLEALTGMADYKLPQLIRYFGAIQYNQELAEKVDNMELIPSGSREEIEIRAFTVWICELISQKIGLTAGEVDRVIWWLGQEVKIDQPYHRTYTIYY